MRGGYPASNRTADELNPPPLPPQASPTAREGVEGPSVADETENASCDLTQYEWQRTYETVRKAHLQAAAQLEHCTCTFEGHQVTNRDPNCWYVLSDTEQHHRHNEVVIAIMEGASR